MTVGSLAGPVMEALRVIVALVAASAGTVAVACPFCDVVGRPLAQRRDAAAVAAVGESGGAAGEEEGVVRQPFVVRSVLRGTGVEPGDDVTARVRSLLEQSQATEGAKP